MLVKFDPPPGELYWAIDKQKPQDYYSFGIISKPKAYQKPRPKAPPAFDFFERYLFKGTSEVGGTYLSFPGFY